MFPFLFSPAPSQAPSCQFLGGFQLSWAPLRGWRWDCGCTLRTHSGLDQAVPWEGAAETLAPVWSLRLTSNCSYAWAVRTLFQMTRGHQHSLSVSASFFLPSKPRGFRLIRQAFAMRRTRVTFLPEKNSQLLLAQFQDMLISANNWGLICIPYELLALWS